MFVPAYGEQEAREAVATSLCYTHALRKLGLAPAGGNHRLFRRYVDEVWRIPTDHFDPDRVRREARRPPISLAEVLVEGSSYCRTTLKRRLYREGLKARRCELCGQDERWHGRPIGLILDHVNGIPDDNRIENLRIVCPNCAATLSTHCGRKNRLAIGPSECARCARLFVPGYVGQRFCSRECGRRHDRRNRGPQPAKRKVPRPPYHQLMDELDAASYLAVGRKYGVSDNAIRKWVRSYEEQLVAGQAAETVPTRRGKPRAMGPTRRS
jgi:hypothetical protein